MLEGKITQRETEEDKNQLGGCQQSAREEEKCREMTKRGTNPL